MIFLLIGVFFWVGFRSYKPGRKTPKSASNPQGVLFWLSRGFSTIDSLLVFPIANATGMTLDRPWRRFLILLGHLIPCLILGWYFPAPLAFLPIFWALVSIIAIARRWSWVEDDREVAMLKRSFENKDFKVGFTQDLRDEAMVAFAVLLLLTPIALRAAFLGLESHLEYDLSQNENVALSSQSYWAWLSLVGTELAKAIPFVDWAEIFDVKGEPFIHFNDKTAAYQCVVFSMRVMVDLVLLAALLQAYSIVSRTSKQKEMFYEDGTLVQLDPFIEPIELANLAAGRTGDWRIRDREEFEAFPEYDEDRLVQLSLPEDGEEEDGPIGSERTALRHAARALAHRDELRPPEHLLYIHTRKERINEDRIHSLIEQIDTKRETISVDELLKAHRALNDKGRMIEMRAKIVRIIAVNTAIPRAIAALNMILTGIGGMKADSRAEVREIALNALALPAINGDITARSAIAYASTNDGAPRVQRQAQALIDRHEEWIKLENAAEKIVESDLHAVEET